MPVAAVSCRRTEVQVRGRCAVTGETVVFARSTCRLLLADVSQRLAPRAAAIHSLPDVDDPFVVVIRRVPSGPGQAMLLTGHSADRAFVRTVYRRIRGSLDGSAGADPERNPVIASFVARSHRSTLRT